jgi:hypothetical protein
LNENELIKQAQEIEEKRKQAAIAVGNFDPMKILEDSKAIKEIYDEKFGVIKYGSLTYVENKKIKTITDTEDRTTNMVYLMLKKAYPDLKLEDVEAWGFEKVARMSFLIGKELTGFLPKPT